MKLVGLHRSRYPIGLAVAAVTGAAIGGVAALVNSPSNTASPKCGPNLIRSAPDRPCDPVVGHKVKDGSVVIYCKRVNSDITPYPCEIRPVKP